MEAGGLREKKGSNNTLRKYVYANREQNQNTTKQQKQNIFLKYKN